MLPSGLLHPRAEIDSLLAAENLTSAEDASLRAHVRVCAECRVYYDQGVLALRAARGGAAGAGELERIQRRAASVSVESPAALRPLPWWAFRIPGYTAGAAFAVAALWVMFRTPEVGMVVVAGEQLLVDGRPVAADQRILEGDWVRAERGNSMIELDGSRGILLREGAEIRFLRDGELAELERGRARFSVVRDNGEANPFRVVAGEARVDVEGTVFVVHRRTATDTLVAVHEGRVAVTTKSNRVQLDPGKETTIRGDTVRPVRDASPESLEEDRGGSDLLDLLVEGAQKVRRKLRRLFGR